MKEAQRNRSADHRWARLKELRAILATLDLDGFLVPRFDAHQSEYCAPHDERLAWLTGFTGSAGAALVTGHTATLFVDGRYTNQAEQQTRRDCFRIRHLNDAPFDQWIVEAGFDGRLGFDPMLIPGLWYDRLRTAAAATGAKLVACRHNPIDLIWADRPQKSTAKLYPHSREFSGQSSTDKRLRIADALATLQADFLVEAQPDNICWLLNIRGGDVAFNPLVHAFAIVDRDGAVSLFIDPGKLPDDLLLTELGNIAIEPMERFLPALSRGSERGRRGIVDPGFAPVACRFAIEAAGGKVVAVRSPLTSIKARKNPIELAGLREANRQDSVAWVQFCAWLTRRMAADGSKITELSAANRILDLRKARPHFLEPSFATISAADGHAAMCHYSPTPESDIKIGPHSIYLLDSGGQYQNGTTDATRTFAFGPVSPAVRAEYTHVLKGHIQLANQRFPNGTKGHQLDALARMHLWQAGLDYDHGTGHGVGVFLSVHEHPQRIQKDASDVALESGMTMTIEPGFYRAGQYGIRIENLTEIVQDTGEFLSFRALTLVPISVDLLEAAMLTESEKDWLNRYHHRVHEEIAPFLDARDCEWLEAVTRPI